MYLTLLASLISVIVDLLILYIDALLMEADGNLLFVSGLPHTGLSANLTDQMLITSTNFGQANLLVKRIHRKSHMMTSQLRSVDIVGTECEIFNHAVSQASHGCKREVCHDMSDSMILRVTD